MASDNKFAVLIDADNISEKYIKFILNEISNDGIVTYKRIYGDWTTPNLNPWKTVLLENCILPIQQFGYTSRKNSTDTAMIIDAMDIFYTGQVNGFCLVSSDSDFTRLAARLREGGMIVVGMGNRQTPKPFISACSRFKYLDILLGSPERQEGGGLPYGSLTGRAERESGAEAAGGGPMIETAGAYATVGGEGDRLGGEGDRRGQVKFSDGLTPDTNKSATHLPTISGAIRAILTESSDDEGWMLISELGNRLVKRYSDFDVRNFGFAKLSLFVKSLDFLEIKTAKNPDNNSAHLYLRVKTAPSPAPAPVKAPARRRIKKA
jgi:uncharacterized LabA/DUF88 family protein